MFNATVHAPAMIAISFILITSCSSVLPLSHIKQRHADLCKVNDNSYESRYFFYERYKNGFKVIKKVPVER